jgi:hypothetical protein
MKKILFAAGLCGLAACSPPAEPAADESGTNKVVASGKIDFSIEEVPTEVLAAAKAARPGFVAAEAQSETREGRRYFDIGGKLADGSEVEFDIMEEAGRWRVVETQRDIALAAAPGSVREAAGSFRAVRVIESTQQDGIVIYELYDSAKAKLEIKWDGKRAEVLTREWAH